MPAPPSEAEIRAVLGALFGLLHAHRPAEEMLAQVLTDDFETGVAHERGVHGLGLPRRAADSPGGWRVAAQIVNGFDDLNDAAARLFSAPASGLHAESRPCRRARRPQRSLGFSNVCLPGACSPALCAT